MSDININYEKMWKEHKEYIRNQLEYYKGLIENPNVNNSRRYAYERKHDMLTETLINMNDIEIKACYDKINETTLHIREEIKNLFSISEDDGK